MTDVRFRGIVLIADGFAGGSARMSGAAVQLRVLDALRPGPLWVHLRDHGAGPQAFANAARSFVQRIRSVQRYASISINTHIDVADELRVHLHVGTRGPSVAEAWERLDRHALVTASVHSVKEAKTAAREGADAVFFSPIFPTSSKPGHPGVGLDELRVCCEALPRTPVVALGGIEPDHVPHCLDAGARSVAVLSGILHADRPAEAAARYTVHLRSI